MQILRFIVLALVVFALGCTPKVHVNTFSAESYPPTTEVEIFSTQRPDRKYLEIAELEVVNEYGRQAQFQALREKAMAIGADAVILTPEAEKGSVLIGSNDGDNSSAFTVSVYRIRGVAVRYLK